MKGNNKSVLNCLAFIAFSIFAILMILSGLNSVGVSILGDTVLKILDTVKNICLVVVLGCMSFKFVKAGKKVLKIIFILAIIVFIAGTIMAWL